MVTVLYFAAVRDLVGLAEEQVPLPGGNSTLQHFVATLVQHRPELHGRLAGVRFAINETFSEPEDHVKSGDVVAVIPPVAGG